MLSLCKFLTSAICSYGELFAASPAKTQGYTWTEARDTCLKDGAALPVVLPTVNLGCYLDMFRELPVGNVPVYSIWSSFCNENATHCGRYLVFPTSPVNDFFDLSLEKSSSASFPYAVCRKGQSGLLYAIGYRLILCLAKNMLPNTCSSIFI